MKTEKKILEMTFPDINVYPIFANPLAIMQSHQETKGWILCNFIQLCSNSVALNFYDFNYKCCPYFNIQRISKKFLQNMNIDVITFIINSIEEGNYIYLLVRRKEIKAYKFTSEEKRERDRFAHDMLIYGYDIKQHKFYIADNFVNGKYSFQQCSFQELDSAIKNMDPKFEPRLGFKGNIELIEFSKDETSTFNLKRVLDSFREYVFSKPTSLWNTMELRNTYGTKKWYFGLECYDYMLQSVYHMNKDSIYIQDYHLMWEHKKHLRRIIAFLMEKNYIAEKEAVQQIQSIEKKALIARNLMLKYSISGKESIKEDIIKIYSQMAIEEKELMIPLINNIEILIDR